MSQRIRLSQHKAEPSQASEPVIKGRTKKKSERKKRKEFGKCRSDS